MGSTYRIFCWDIISTIKQVDADSSVKYQHVKYWCQSLANRLRGEIIGKRPTGRYLSIFTNVPVQTFTTNANPNQVANRKYIDLPASILDYEFEKGVNYASWMQDGTCPPEWTKNLWQATSPDKAHRLYMSNYEKPSPENVYYYVVDQRLYLLGLENIPITECELGLYTTLEANTNLVNDDEEIDLSEEYIDILRMRVLALGRFMLSVPKDNLNDGEDNVVLPTKAATVPTEQQQ